MPNRVIKETIKFSEQIDSLSWFEEVVFYRLMVTADDYGCMDGRPLLLKSVLFPISEKKITKKAVEDAVDKLASIGLIGKYTANGQPYIFFPTWEKHQRIRNKHRKYPEPPKMDDFDEAQTVDSQMTADWMSESESEVESEIESKFISTAPLRFAVPKLILKDETEFEISTADFLKLSNAYPNLDTIQEFREMSAWCLSNPSKRKTRKGIMRFINGWLAREQDERKRGDGNGAKSTGTAKSNNPDASESTADWGIRYND